MIFALAPTVLQRLVPFCVSINTRVIGFGAVVAVQDADFVIGQMEMLASCG